MGARWGGAGEFRAGLGSQQHAAAASADGSDNCGQARSSEAWAPDKEARGHAYDDACALSVLGWGLTASIMPVRTGGRVRDHHPSSRAPPWHSDVETSDQRPSAPSLTSVQIVCGRRSYEVHEPNAIFRVGTNAGDGDAAPLPVPLPLPLNWVSCCLLTFPTSANAVIDRTIEITTPIESTTVEMRRFFRSAACAPKRGSEVSVYSSDASDPLRRSVSKGSILLGLNR